MSEKTENPSGVSDLELRKFGYVMAGFFALFFGVLMPWWWSMKWAYWPWVVAGVFLVFALLAPRLLRGPYKFWMRLGRVLEWVNTRLVLGVVFVLVFAPLGWGLRALGKDTLQKKWDSRLATYRVNKVPRKADHMERQF
ncbi:SxtJ family membrane protein [Acidovorax sp. D2M1]|uniref:SxtJ family membrane protein n=1 Tax=Acidovorax benzenivorans TaxID=2987520 RepID=A0ABT5RWE8_9BURK|nr:SxtJ family membrane protein [Acidovorax benzenivorans]MDD2178024.1 SxtJ family membrane protein [Acidovorax benzenivorans]